MVFMRYDPLGHHVLQSLRPRILCCLQQLESYQSQPQVQYEHHIRRIDPICQDSCPTVFATLSFPPRLSHSRPSFAIRSSHLQPAVQTYNRTSWQTLINCARVFGYRRSNLFAAEAFADLQSLPEITASDRRRKFQAVIGAGSR